MTDIVITQPNYKCPKHGDIGNDVVIFPIPGCESVYCLRCWKDHLDASGLPEVKLDVES